MAMRAVVPLTITGAMLTSTDVPADPYPVWDAGTTYQENSSDGEPIVQRSNRLFVLTTASSQGEDPLLRPDVWEEFSATNAWKMFDPLGPISDPTTNADSIEVVLEPGQNINAIALLGLQAASVQVVIDDGSNGEVYNETFNLATRVVNNWYDHWWGDFTRKTLVTIFNVPPSQQPIITITINNVGSTAACGKVILGKQRSLGCTMYGVKGRRKDLSENILTRQGTRRLVRRRTIRTREYTLRIASKDLDYVDQVLGDLYGTPTLFVGSTVWNFATLYGIPRDSEPSLTNAQYSFLPLKVEEI